MTVRKTLLATVAALSAFAAAPAFADDFDSTRAHQQRRIQNGRADGSLTRHEYVELEREQARINGMIARARVDGRVDPYERAEIARAQEAASRHIYAEKHDAERRPRHWGWYRRWW